MSLADRPVDARGPAMIGGIFRPASDGVAAELLRAMASPVSLDPRVVQAEAEPVGLFAAGSGLVERTPDIWLAADADLLNADDLQRLAPAGSGLLSALAHLYQAEGPAFVRRLRGAFALIVWDRRRRSLLLAVDHFGLRRLHYRTDGRTTAFASRVSAAFAPGGRQRRVDATAIYQYLNFGFVPSPETAFAGVRRIPPGYMLSVGAGHTKLEPFWDMTYLEERHREERAASAMYRLTHQAVAESLKGVVPKNVGAFLSGGTDSSTVVGLMARITGEAVNTFSIGFNEDQYNELRYAEITARHFGAAHYTRVVTADVALDAVPRLVQAYDEPFGNNSVLATYLCAQLARESGVSELLGGDGGDEIFGGNERYRTDRIFASYERVPAVLRRGLLEPVLLGLPDAPGPIGRAQRYIRRARIPNPRRFYSYEFYAAQHAAELLAPDFLRSVEVDTPWRTVDRVFGEARASSELNRLLYLDLKLTIGDNDILKVTRSAELAGVRVRFPLLALPLVEFTGTLPARFKVHGLEKRYLFKRAFRSLLPADTLTKRKHGFGVPISDWLKSDRGFRELGRDVLLSARSTQRGYFKKGALEELFALHEADTTPFYGDTLWSLLMLELWHQRHVDGAGTVR
jgi:asparagine synthase (glutamine-hydrolysing)